LADNPNEPRKRLGNLKQTPKMTNHFTLRLAAILLMAAGYGWAGGHFIPTNAPFWAYLFQFVLLLILSAFAIGFLRASARSHETPPATTRTHSPAHAWRNTLGLTIFASLTLLINVANIIRGSMNPGATNSGSFGSHNSFADLVPIGLIIFGDILWLLTTILQPQRLPFKKTAEN
jgi:hypothetical protein